MGRRKSHDRRGALIEGERIYLRRIRLSDANRGYCSWMNDPEVNEFLKDVEMTEEGFNKLTKKHIVKSSRNMK